MYIFKTYIYIIIISSSIIIITIIITVLVVFVIIMKERHYNKMLADSLFGERFIFKETIEISMPVQCIDFNQSYCMANDWHHVQPEVFY